MDTKLTDLKLKPALLAELLQLGFETSGDMAHLSNAECLRIPGMAGRGWRKIAAAVGREPLSGMRKK
ncbi:hypothetical protein ELH67_33040 (plasmid) [Rhizobium ruizarguesonis]|uniref:hypothetical protein n=1 Tax=Rhizobium TaxID=379 RepID=UPI00035E59A9|nr:hypothetical protein [Rhizobium ruizarguesonis]TAZ86929.1 hypothetical protein ELH67_33040 [Rhizobium ruizarguesonis]TBA32446.1 hypothetical protein ELH60_28495 [Rhizobium ruizarguesonis]TBC53327.1 hypothetical protein ELH36_34545 [Rhizobium ruizarguesonis]